MKLFSYVLRLNLYATILCLLVLLGLVVSATLMETAGHFADSEGGELRALYLTLYSSIDYTHQLLPVAGLLGVLTAGSLMAKRGEILALHTVGVSLLRQCVPLVALSLLTVFVGIVLAEQGVPWALQRRALFSTEVGGGLSALDKLFNRRTHWFRDGDTILYLPRVDTRQEVFLNPVIYRLTDGVVREVISGDLLRHRGGQWLLENVRIFGPRGLEEQGSVVSLDLTVTPQDLTDTTGNPRYLGFFDLRGLIERRERSGLDVTAYQFELHQRFAHPLLALWFQFLALPWALRPLQRGSLAGSLGGGVGLIGLMLVLTHVFRMLALNHTIPAVLGAWGLGLVCVSLIPVNALMCWRQVHRNVL